MEKASISEIISEIRTEYKKIDIKWLSLHYKTSVILAAFSHAVEIVMAFFIINSEQLNTTVSIYIIKFIVIPVLLNLIFIVAEHRTVYSKSLSQEFKTYVVSFLFVLICFVLFSVHGAFPALYFIFSFPIILTTVYSDYMLTSITSLLSIISVIISELFINWDIDKMSIWNSSFRLFDFILSLMILLAIFGVCMVIIRFTREKGKAAILKEIERHNLIQKLHIDELTGIYNRRAFHAAMSDVEEDNSGIGYVFVMMDIDNFKSINDTLGHLTGDWCIAEVGRIMKESCQTGIPYRYGGDEFCILFKGQDVDEVLKICRKIQDELKAVSSEIDLGDNLTVSIGISIHKKKTDMAQMILNTDSALYEAKAEKNAIRIYAEHISKEA